MTGTGADPLRGARAVGRRGVLIDAASPPAAAAAIREVAGAAGIDLADVVPGAATVLVVAVDGSQRDRLAATLAEVGVANAAPPTSDAGGPAVTIPVRYDGDDLDDVARATGLDRHAVVATHTGATYRVGFCGFAPGFAYLTGLPAALHLPRRDRPRTRVPPGSVAVADRYSAVYPRATPGGWHLLGSTDVVVWDTGRERAALLQPGATVRFEAAG